MASADGISDAEWSMAVQLVVATSTKNAEQIRAAGRDIGRTKHRHELVWAYLLGMTHFAVSDYVSTPEVVSRDDLLALSVEIYRCWSPNGAGDRSLLRDILLSAMENEQPTDAVMDSSAHIAMAVGCLVSHPEWQVDGLRPRVAEFWRQRLPKAND